jgi:hypothetical protein
VELRCAAAALTGSAARNVASEHPQVARRIEEYLKRARTEPRPHNTGSFEFIR